MKKIVLAAMIASASSVSAFAADLSARLNTKAPASPVYDWSGFYVGGQVGGASMSASFKDFSDTFDNQGLNADRQIGVTGGVYGGYNIQRGSFVYGIDASWSYYGAKTESIPFDFRPSSLKTKLNDGGSVKARVGLASADTLVYVAAGPAWARSEFSVLEPFDLVAAEDKKTVWGLAGAVGIEHMLTPNWVLRGQIQYTEFRSQRFETSSDNDTAAFGQQTSLVEGTIGLAYKFGESNWR